MIAKYLGRNVTELLETDPFAGWTFNRSIEMDTDPPRIDYEATVLDVVCDLNETVRTIFLYAEGSDGVRFTDIPFSWSRARVRQSLGTPSKSGEPSTSPLLGPSGAWDRFSNVDYTIHVEYKIETDQIDKVTLMRNDVVPQ